MHTRTKHIVTIHYVSGGSGSTETYDAAEAVRIMERALEGPQTHVKAIVLRQREVAA